MAGSFLIFLREGIEGSMICAILLTYLAAGGRRDMFRWVLGGAGVALAGSAVVGGALYILVRSDFVGSRAQAWFETITFAMAVVVLTYMTFWMKRHARRLSADLKLRVDGAVTGGSGMALALVAAATVGREAVETAIFTVAIALQSSPAQLLLGAAGGLAVALAVSVAIYRLGVKLNLGKFFTFVGAALMVVAAGLLANTVQNLQALGVLADLPGAAIQMWDTSRLLPQDSTLGDILHGLVGYAAAPSLLQLTAYVVFLVVGLTFFLRPTPRRLPA
ncbi:MAG: high-affinity iron transporter [Chloroflexota bacterium]|jgi:high-affinity iron transporter|nr:high-affinity iron transporter [Chloroflexota bacterium]